MPVAASSRPSKIPVWRPASAVELLPNAAAIDAGTHTACTATDQRGAPRPQDGDGDQIPHCDVGAYEREALSIFASGFES